MFSRIHKIGKVDNVFSKYQKKFGLKHIFAIEPTKLFETCPLRPKDVSLKVILTGAYTKEEIIAKLKPYVLDKPLVRQIYKEWLDTNFHTTQICPGFVKKTCCYTQVKVTERVMSRIRRSARIQNKTYGVNLVNDDDNKINERVISTCTIAHDPDNFEEARIVLK